MWDQGRGPGLLLSGGVRWAEVAVFPKVPVFAELNGVRPSRESVHGWCSEHRRFPVDLVKSTGLEPVLSRLGEVEKTAKLVKFVRCGT